MFIGRFLVIKSVFINHYDNVIYACSFIYSSTFPFKYTPSPFGYHCDVFSR
jgi:hypothetical protein